VCSSLSGESNSVTNFTQPTLKVNQGKGRKTAEKAHFRRKKWRLIERKKQGGEKKRSAAPGVGKRGKKENEK